MMSRWKLGDVESYAIRIRKKDEKSFKRIVLVFLRACSGDRLLISERAVKMIWSSSIVVMMIRLSIVLEISSRHSLMEWGFVRP